MYDALLRLRYALKCNVVSEKLNVNHGTRRQQTGDTAMYLSTYLT